MATWADVGAWIMMDHRDPFKKRRRENSWSTWARRMSENPDRGVLVHYSIPTEFVVQIFGFKSPRRGNCSKVTEIN
jgi:hypothetical protein